MYGVTVEQWILVIGAIIGAIITMVTLIEKVSKLVTMAKTPNEQQDRRIDALEKRCDHYDHYFNNDKRRIENLERSMAVLMKSQFALVRHAINGNDIDECKEAERELQEYLADQQQGRGWMAYGTENE